jgi:hypothetical protein
MVNLKRIPKYDWLTETTGSEKDGDEVEQSMEM